MLLHISIFLSDVIEEKGEEKSWCPKYFLWHYIIKNHIQNSVGKYIYQYTLYITVLRSMKIRKNQCHICSLWCGTDFVYVCKMCSKYVVNIYHFWVLRCWSRCYFLQIYRYSFHFFQLSITLDNSEILNLVIKNIWAH